MAKPHMAYQEYLNEDTTQITGIYNVEDGKAIRMVMAAQKRDYFSGLDDSLTICTLERVDLDPLCLQKE